MNRLVRRVADASKTASQPASRPGRHLSGRYHPLNFGASNLLELVKARAVAPTNRMESCVGRIEERNEEQLEMGYSYLLEVAPGANFYGAYLAE